MKLYKLRPGKDTYYVIFSGQTKRYYNGNKSDYWYDNLSNAQEFTNFISAKSEKAKLIKYMTRRDVCFLEVQIHKIGRIDVIY